MAATLGPSSVLQSKITLGRQGRVQHVCSRSSSSVAWLEQHTLRGNARWYGSTHHMRGAVLHRGRHNGFVWRAGQWLENSAETDIDLPVDVVWEMWRDRTSIPNWMPWISSVELIPEDESLSRWVLSTNQFGRDWTFSWIAKDLTPVKFQKIHWRSLEGSASTALLEVNNRGSVRFYKRSPTKTGVKLTVSYEIPEPLLVFANALSPIVNNILAADMERFREYALQKQPAQG